MFQKLILSAILTVLVLPCFTLPAFGFVNSVGSGKLKNLSQSFYFPRIETDKTAFNFDFFQQNMLFKSPQLSADVNQPAKKTSDENLTTTTEISSRIIGNPAGTAVNDGDKTFSMTIPKIGLNKIKLVGATKNKMPILNQKMLFNPIYENQISPEPCSGSGNVYIYGHSEPAVQNQENFPAVRVFERLDSLQTGDIIEIVSPAVRCKYKVTKWDKLVTDNNNRVSREDFMQAFYPNFARPSLTIQTCEKGSSTVRLLLRAEMVF